MPFDDRPDSRDEAASRSRDGDAIVCARCGHAVTRRDSRVEVGGRHEHVHVNAHGYVHRVGCFREADGAVEATEPTRAWTWFPGYAWQIAVCRRCGAHVGWRFVREGDAFWGVALDAVRDVT